MYKALLIASIAAIGNAMFVYGQRRSTVNSYPFTYLIAAVFICAVLVGAISLIYNSDETIIFVPERWWVFCVGGLGMTITYLGFYFLYTNYGATYYIVYAVLSIITTTIVVGIILLGEKWNYYQLIGMVLAIAAIVMFTVGRLIQE